ncbi:MAG: MoaD/ThiS family protein [Anaerolineaceae bacterium]|nr:MoaD/ThiS family protein [Anaerolineaceae bacterium]
MKITLKFLANYRQYLPPEAIGGQYDMEIETGLHALEIVAQFGVPTDENSVILVNGRTPKQEDILQDGDIVFVFPAMAGG